MALNKPSPHSNIRVVALAGGVGGAKLAEGLAHCLPPEALTVIVNTGDDFTHYGLAVSPDLDTVMYTLAGLAHPVNGWGLAGDTQQMITMMRRYGDEAWFGLGDMDMATNLLRTQALVNGEPLSRITDRMARALGVTACLLPMSDDRVATMVETVERGTLAFQEYFVRYRWQPTVTRLWFDGADRARPAPGILDALAQADAIILCPSNPLLSIEPILQVPGIRAALEQRKVPCVAVSPIIGGQAVKGPAAKLMAELSMEVSPAGVASYYGSLIDGLVVDTVDREVMIQQRKLVTSTWMKTNEDRGRLAREILEWMEGWGL